MIACVCVLIICVASLIAQKQHHEFISSKKTEIGKSELEDLKTKVEALRAAQGFKR